MTNNDDDVARFRKALRLIYEALDVPGAKPNFIGVVAFGIDKGIVPLSTSDFHRLIGSDNWYTGTTEELIAWLQREGWL